MKIKAGDYVRFYDGDIGIIAEYKYEEQYENGHTFFLTREPNHGLCCNEKQFKTSPNIMDLVKVGDYVNGKEVDSCYLISGKTLGFYEYDEDTKEMDFIKLIDVDIETIVTKERFERMSYHVKD